MLASEPAGQCADRKDLGIARFPSPVEDQFGDCRRVQHRLGLRRAAQAGDPAGGGGEGLAVDIALAAVAGFAQGDIQVHQAGGGDQPGGVDHAGCLEAGGSVAEGCNLAGLDMDIGDLVQATGRVDYAGATDTDGHSASSCCSIWRCAVWPLMAMDSTAMRTAMP
ncbi:hypothetical protein D3C81_1579560 [compost metagenome]